MTIEPPDRPLEDPAFGPTRAAAGDVVPTLAETPTLAAFRGKSLLVLIASSVICGALGTVAAFELASFLAEQPEPPGARIDSHHLEVVLEGPDGPVSIPAPDGATVVNVWLEGCQDCMPAFEAWRDHARAALDDVVIVNVAYGRATKQWAERFRVDDRLVFDLGTGPVRPLGISTFTTLVVDRDGTILLRARPTDDGFVGRVRGALEAARRRAAATTEVLAR